MTNQPKIGQEVLIHGYIDEIRKDTIIIRNDGGYFGTVEHEITDIEMPNTIEVLDKIRDEIEDLDEGITSYHNDRPWIFKDEVLQIINKYTKGDTNE